MSGSRNMRVYVAGHRGMVGSAVCRALRAHGHDQLITRTREELDLCDPARVEAFFDDERPDCVIFAAARVGGIHANNAYPAEFIQENLMMATSAVHAAWRAGVRRFVFLGSTCIYPREASQPVSEDSLMSGPLEPTNEAYAIAKIAGLKMCEFYRRQYGVLFHSAMPTNLYGPGDNYHPDHSHVLPALLRRIHEAKEEGTGEVTVWGTGSPRRDFLHVDDLAEALLYLLSLSDPPDRVNVGTSKDISILELARMIADVVGYRGEIVVDPSRPDGTPLKRANTTLLQHLGWTPSIGLRDGIELTYASFLRENDAQVLRSF